MADRQRIVVVGLRGIPGIMGGVETHCENLLPRIAQLAPDLELEAVARRPYVDSWSPTSFGDVRVTPLYSPKQRSFEAIVSTLIGIVHARRRGARLVHIHAIGPALLAPVARALGMNVLLTHHGTDYNREKWGGAAKAALRAGERAGVRFANRVIAVAPSLAADLRARFPAQAARIEFVPNGRPDFPEGTGGTHVLEELGLDPGDFILAVGRLVPEKGFHFLIDAFRRCRSAKKLVIVGGADHDSAYSRDLTADPSAGIVFAGIRNRAELKQLYEAASLFVLPSTHEGLPIAAIEAGSFGCPLMLSDIQPNCDLGLPPRNYFPSKDVAALAERLSKPAANFAVPREAFGEFDWDRIAEQTLAIYRSILER